MKARGQDFARGIPASARQASILFFCGPDEAGAWAAAQKVIAALPDPGERIELSGADIKSDAARLGDEARSSSLFGGARHIVARVSGDEAHDALKAMIETGDAGAGAAAPVLVIATAATDKSRTAKLLEKRKDALVAMFYEPELKDVVAAVRAMADAAGLRLGGDLADRIAQAAALDLRLAQSEVTKLALYMDASPEAPVSVSLPDYAAIGAAREEDGFDPIVDAVLSGNLEQLPRELKRMREHGLNPVGLLLAIERRVTSLAKLAGRLGPSGKVASLGPGEKRAFGLYHWRLEPEFDRQLKQWNRPVARGSHETGLDRLIPRLVALHRTLITNSQTAHTLLAQDLAEIARFAARR